MPSSSTAGKSIILEWFNQSQSAIKTILDVGPGQGTYFDLFNPLSNNKICWECVEIWEPYIYRFKLYRRYQSIYKEDIRKFVPNRPYDLVIFGDILEHMPEEDAIKTIQKARTYAKFYIVSLPLDAETGAGPGTGDKDWGNPYEVHRELWSDKKFISLPFASELLVKHKEGGIGIYIGKSDIFDAYYFSKKPTPSYTSHMKLFKELWYSKKEIFNFLKKFIPNKVKRIIKWAIYLVLNPIIMKNNNKRKINIGAGGENLFGFISIDIDPLTKPDIIRDIEKGLPFDDNSVDEIKCSHTLEHIKDLNFVLKEFYRVCKNGAKIIITVPLMDASDMTHIRFFSKDTFRTLTDPYYYDKPYYFVGKYKEVCKSFKKLSTCEEMTIVLEVIK